MNKYSSVGFYKKWIPTFLKTIVRITYKRDLFRILFSFFSSKDQKIRIDKDKNYVIFPSGYFLDSFCTYTDIFIENDYDLGNIDKDSTGAILDFGANFGFSAKYFSTKLPNTEIYAFEPDKENYEILKKNLLKEISSKKVIAVNKAISDNSRGMYFDKANSSGKPALRFSNKDLGEIAKVESISPNEIIEKYKITNVLILKIDIEGGEHIIFNNYHCMDKLLPIARYIFLEIHDIQKDDLKDKIMNTINENNFQILEDRIHPTGTSCVIKAVKR